MLARPYHAALVCALALAATPALAATENVLYAGRHFHPMTLEVRDGDSLRICNRDQVFSEPFSLSKHNAFGGEHALMKLAPGDCATVTMHNPTSAPLRVSIFDALHTGVMARVSVASSSGCHGFAGRWSTQWGEVTLDSSGNGTYKWKGLSHISGALSDGGRVLTGTWSQVDGHGTLHLTLGADDRSFAGTWANATTGETGIWHGTCAE